MLHAPQINFLLIYKDVLFAKNEIEKWSYNAQSWLKKSLNLTLNKFWDSLHNRKKSLW